MLGIVSHLLCQGGFRLVTTSTQSLDVVQIIRTCVSEFIDVVEFKWCRPRNSAIDGVGDTREAPRPVARRLYRVCATSHGSLMRQQGTREPNKHCSTSIRSKTDRLHHRPYAQSGLKQQK